MSEKQSTTAQKMPTVDRVAANRAAVAARQARAELKRKLRGGELSPLKVLEFSKVPGHAAATLRITDYLLSFPSIGQVKADRIREDLQISDRKRLGGLGALQRERLERFVRERSGALPSGEKPPLTVLAGPTAVGKGTVVNYLREHYPNIKLSVSATTRDPRPGEVDGEHYFFVDQEGFDRMLAGDELLEWAMVHNKHRYGTPRGPIAEASEQGELVLLEIDLQGARQVRKSMPDAKLVFLAPPSWDELVNRLVGRGTEDAEERERRLETAKTELAAADEFDEIIVNDEVPKAAARLFELMRGEGLN